MRLYFSNGGGPCYVVSVGDYDYTRTDANIQSAIEGGISAIELEDEPTILLSPDAVVLSPTQLGSIQSTMLAQCNKLKDRFTVMDLIENASSDDVGEGVFRTKVGTQYLKYGAAYGPWLETTFPFELQYSDLNIVDKTDTDATGQLDATATGNIADAEATMTLIQAQLDANYLSSFDNIASTNKTNLQTKVGYLKSLTTGLRAMLTAANSDILSKVIESVDVNSVLNDIIREAMAYDKGYPTANPVLSVFANTDFDGNDVTLPTGTTIADFNYDLGTVSANASIYNGNWRWRCS